MKTSDGNPIVIFNEQDYPPYHVCKEGDVIMVRLLNEDGNRDTYEKLASTREDAKFSVHDSIVTLPIVGGVKVAGLNKNEIIELLLEKYREHIIEPILDVEFASLKVNILGEVQRPSQYYITENLNLVDGLGLAGGLTEYALFDNVKIIRGTGASQEVIVVDITSIDILNNPKIILRNNDIVYVEPRKVKRFDTAVRPYLFLTSILSSAAAIFIVILRTQ